jgi:formylglycine-generating enzyme required for sulfatase activity
LARVELPKLEDRGGRRWYVNGQSQALAVIEGPVAIEMGSPPDEPNRVPDEIRHRRRISRRFAIAAKEVTREQYGRFVAADPKNRAHDMGDVSQYSPDPQGPQVAVCWYDAAAYCNWLSAQEHLEPCYEPNGDGAYAEGMKLVPDFLERSGYRLPTEAEWEYICRAGAATSRYYGGAANLLENYGWYLLNSPATQVHRCGQLKPNELGLFDLLGNEYEWCLDAYGPYSRGGEKEAAEDTIMSSAITDKNPRILRGGASLLPAAILRSAIRIRDLPSNRLMVNGFRVARTCR